jgi:signal transduction histidine kinase
MRLAEFIVQNRKPILAEWEAFAKSCAPASGTMNVRSLADHANAMLTVIARDLETPQGNAEQSAKSRGLLSEGDNEESTAAQEHGSARAESGFTIDQMVAEFRALRASVTRLWLQQEDFSTAEHVDDLTRFNEAIDQALAESIVTYTQDIDQSKDIFLAILGHDLKSPLGAVTMSASFMLETGGLVEPHLTLTRQIANSSKRMQQMIGDLLDFTRSRLGDGIPILRAPVSVGKIVHDVVDEVRAGSPDRTVEIDARTGITVDWDCARISQALANLLSNAVEHSPKASAVTVQVEQHNGDVAITIHNEGDPMSAEQLDGIFGSMKSTQGATEPGNSGPLGHLGLGLYIAERIVHAHKGRIQVESTESSGTTFRMLIPPGTNPSA